MSTALGESLGDLGKQLEAITEKMKEEDSRVEDDLVSLSSIFEKTCLYTPRKLCLWEGILFSSCPKVRPCVRNVLFL